jgi:metallo-beta-lactamase class B
MYYKDSPVRPFKLTDEFFHIGSLHGPCYLLDCGEELALIDTSCPENLDFLLSNIKEIGYDVSRVKHIIHTHGHFDHYGCTNELVAITGATTYGGKEDLDYFKGADPYNKWGEKIAFTPDVLLGDGDVLSFGNQDIRFVHTPGHSEGVMSLFLTLHVDGVPYLGGMFGGAGYAALEGGLYSDFEMTKRARRQYVAGIDKIINEPVKIHIGNHLGNNNSLEKLEYKGDGNPFLIFETYRPFLTERRRYAMELIDKESES